MYAMKFFFCFVSVPLVTVVTRQPGLVTEFGDSYFSTNRIRFFDMTTQTPERHMKGYFLYCPQFSARLNKTCYSPMASCTDRCGEFLNEITAKTSVCSCDMFCQTFEDCCWDYQSQCPETVRQYSQHYSHLQVTRKVCEEGIAVVEECNNFNATGSKQNEDIPEGPLVSLKDLGIQFKNIQVYMSCFYYQTIFNSSVPEKLNVHNHRNGSNNSVVNVMQWSRIFVSKKYVFYKDLERLINTDKSTMNAFLYHSPPNGVKKRLCRRPIEMHCLHIHDRPKCQISQHITFLNMRQMCGVYSVKSPEWYMTSTRPYSTTQREKIDGTTIETIPNNSLHENQKCFLNQRRPKQLVKQKIYKFRFRVDFYKNKNSLVEYSNFEGLSWEKVICVKQNTYHECDLKVLCKPGYLLKDNQCVRPRDIIIYAFGVDINRLFKIVNGIFTAIVDTFGDKITFKTDKSLEFEDVPLKSRLSIVQLKSRVLLHNYYVHHNGSDLPISEVVIDYIRTIIANELNLNLLIVCMDLERVSFEDEDRWLVGNVANDNSVIECERVFSYPDNFIIKRLTFIGKINELIESMIRGTEMRSSGAHFGLRYNGDFESLYCQFIIQALLTTNVFIVLMYI